MRIGLTGGIASGKSTVCSLFSACGIDIIDADLAARQVVEPGTTGLLEIVRLFGQQVLDVQGRLDRQLMRRQIFSNPENRSALESIIHPLVCELLQRKAAQSQSAYCILCIPLLVENRLQAMVDRVLVVDVETEIQKKRLIVRDASDPKQVASILAAQASRAQRLAVADDVIDNNQEPARLQSRVASLHLKYLRLAEIWTTKPL